MPPKLLSDNKKHIVIRPFCYVQENDIIAYAQAQQYPIIPCTLCGSQDNLARKRIGHLIDTLAKENVKIPSNILSALQNIRPSQLMDQQLWDFKHLENDLTEPRQSLNESIISDIMLDLPTASTIT
jgi:tRNA 2-thiocytidine biosynthesis protein TtcA